VAQATTPLIAHPGHRPGWCSPIRARTAASAGNVMLGGGRGRTHTRRHLPPAAADRSAYVAGRAHSSDLVRRRRPQRDHGDRELARTCPRIPYPMAGNRPGSKVELLRYFPQFRVKNRRPGNPRPSHRLSRLHRRAAASGFVAPLLCGRLEGTVKQGFWRRLLRPTTRCSLTPNKTCCSCNIGTSQRFQPAGGPDALGLRIRKHRSSRAPCLWPAQRCHSCGWPSPNERHCRPCSIA